jgi:hypothetical protein
MQKFLIIIIYVVFLVFASFTVKAIDSFPQEIKPSINKEYVVSLFSGDVLYGYVVEFTEDTLDGEGIRFRTEIGTATIFADQIKEIIPENEYYKHMHRIFLQPTAEPIGSNAFIGAFELVFLYMGFGISDFLSITAGRSILPIAPSSHQISEFNAKVSFYSEEFQDFVHKVSFAAGFNLAFANHNNRFTHYYITASALFPKTIITGSVFLKTGSGDAYRFRFDNEAADFFYEDGSVGVGFGFDTRLSERSGLHAIGEIWNSNVLIPTNSGALLGLRLAGRSFAADFGFAFTTNPFFVPFTSFVWTPF